MLLITVSGFGFSNLAFGQGVATSGGVDVDGTWYLGEGLKVGDYFEYSLCEIDLYDCAPIKLKMWIKGVISHETETLWDASVVVIDGSKIIKGSMALGKTAPEPILFDNDLSDYAIAFKSSLAWLSAFATGNQGDRIHGPQEFRAAAWGKIGAIGGAQLTPVRAETITVPVGVVDTVVVGWYSGKYNEIWIVDEFPFPVKALTYAWITTGVPPIMHKYILLDFQEDVTDDPFSDVVETVPREELPGCTTEFSNHVGKHVTLNTYKMIIDYKYAPEFPVEGCDIDWIINFMNPFNEVEFIDQVHYDIWVVDEDGSRLRSYAQDLGRNELFNGFGQLHFRLPVKEDAGLARYSIFVYGTGPEYQVPDATMGGYVTIEVEIDENTLFESSAPVQMPTAIPSWIKFTAGAWVDGNTSNTEFISAIKFLVEDGIIVIPQTQQGSGESTAIPSWIKFTTGAWVDGNTSDTEFISAIQFLITEGILVTV